MWSRLCGTGLVAVALLLAFHGHPSLLAGAALQPLEPVDVALDPGHSSWDVGATGGGLAEYQLTLDVANRVRARLEDRGMTVRLTRTDSSRVAPAVPRDPTEATRVEQEARIAAAGPASVFVSI